MIDLKSYFHDRYKGGEDFVENVILPIFGEDKYEDAYGLDVLELYPEYVKMATSSGISQILQMGTIHIPMNPTNVFDITVFSRVQMERNRVNIQQLVRNIMGTYSSAFMVFHYDDDARWDWRFTFCSKFGSNQDATDSKRYTFLLGPNQSCRTAADNFKKLADKQGNIELQDIVKAFDVESLSKEFFEKYKVRYGRFVAHVIGKEYVDKGEGKGEWKEKDGLHPSELFYGLDEDEKVVRDYVKKLLGRIVFLHFLQKKGWLGATDEEWTNGSHDFMFQLFDKASEEQKDNFLDEILEPLFSCLDTPLTERREVFDTKVDGLRSIRVPFLGGLFERTDEDKAISIFPRELFADLFEFLSQYNFTIDENDPNDAQVGVDPEMLGRIFENLLEDNKDKGAFYTPKEIVQYMCRESLIAYLQTGVADEPTRKALAEFVRTHDVAALGGRDADLAQNVSQCLRNVKICDPAIGSGAFPMGLLNELFMCRGAIEDFSNAADIKRHIIQQNIYGVDIEKGAVEIARLRFWLSLIIDAEKPDVLPNMDFKIMQGNSLIEQYRGFDLSHIMEVKTEVHDGLQLQMFEDEVDVIRADVKRTISDYFTEKDHDKRRAMRRDIQQKIQQQINAQHFSVDISDIKDIAATDQFFLWHTWFSDVFEENGGFDIVIGNPPWGADLSRESKILLKNTYKEIDSSTPNSFAYFIGWGLRNFTSSLMFVLPDSVLIKDFKKTRELLSAKVREVKWYQNCGIPKEKRLFKDVEHDICIVCLDNMDRPFVHFQTNNYENGHYESNDSMALKSNVLKSEFDFVFNLKATSTDWIIASKLLKHPPLDSVAQCHEGIHSGNVRDKLFIKGYKPNLKPMYYGGKAGDIIAPYVSYMCGWYVDYRTSIIDTEVGEYASLRDEKLFRFPKIYVTRTGNPFKAFYDEDSYASNNFFSLQMKNYENNTKDNLLFLLPFINSKVCQFFIRRFAAPRLGDSFIETKIIHLLKFPIPFANKERQSIIKLVDQIIIAKKENPQADTSAWEAEIDKLVYALYGLTEEEIKVVEGKE